MSHLMRCFGSEILFWNFLSGKTDSDRSDTYLRSIQKRALEHTSQEQNNVNNDGSMKLTGKPNKTISTNWHRKSISLQTETHRLALLSISRASYEVC